MTRTLQFSYIKDDEEGVKKSKTPTKENIENNMIVGFVVLAFSIGSLYLLWIVLSFTSFIMSKQNIHGDARTLLTGLVILAFTAGIACLLWVVLGITTPSSSVMTKEKIKYVANKIWEGFVILAFVTGSWYLLWVVLGVAVAPSMIMSLLCCLFGLFY